MTDLQWMRLVPVAGLLWGAVGVVGCAEPEGLMRAKPAEVTVQFDFDHRPLPDIPLPNDIATRPDDSTPTGLRINASVLAPTGMEQRVRQLIDGINGWGVYQPITIPFTGPLSVASILDGHRDIDYATENDVLYLINVDRDSDQFGEIHHLDVGNGNYPVVLEKRDNYGDNDPRRWTLSLPFEEADEDLNANGELDPGEDANHNGFLDPGEDLNANGLLDPPEDSDADGILDKPNYLPGRTPGRDDLVGRADALMSFYERETHTLIVAPLAPLQEETTYAVVVTRRILDANEKPVGSPFAWVNHTSQTDDLEPLMEVLPEGLDPEEIAFAFSYTTESITKDWIAVREGLYELGPQAHLGEDYPAELKGLFPVKTTDSPEHPQFQGRADHLLFQEDWQQLLNLILLGFFEGGDANSEQFRAIADGHKYIDFHAMGVYESPQLFSRYDSEGNPLNLDLQSWPSHLHSNPAEARREEIPFWLVVPRKEVSIRGQGQMAPVVLLGHGYTSNRGTELMGFAGFFAEFGVAVISTDNVSHGIPITPDNEQMFLPLMRDNGIEPAFWAVKFARGGFVDEDDDGFIDRHFQDLDRDGTIDSGADFWTAYLFHMRDMVRQSTVDYMQLIRIIRSWDGKRTWEHDVNNDGQGDLAGDFDGDGVVDIGSESPIYVMGASLGGIMATALGSLEPEIDAIIPIAGGGRLSDVGLRSQQGGVPQAVLMRAMGPIYLTTLMDDGRAVVSTQVTELNRLPTIPLRTLPGAGEATEDNPALLPGDTMVVENLANGEIGCSYLLSDVDGSGAIARARVALPSDLGDDVRIHFYRGPVLVTGGTECEIIEDVRPLVTIKDYPAPFDAEGNQMTFEGIPMDGGPLKSLAEGLGLRRANPEIRRFMGLAQVVLDPTDPGVLARHLAAQPFRYPNKGDKTGANFMIVTTVGDMSVPAHGGMTVGRAAGVIDYLNIDPRYGVPPNQVLIDTYTAEAVNVLGRVPYANPPPPEDEVLRNLLQLDGSNGSHWDVEAFSQGNDIWGANVPRLDPPLNLVLDKDMWGNDLGGLSGAVFPFASPKGQHGFALPGEMSDWAVKVCREEMGDSAPECNPEFLVGETFDVGWFMFHSMAAYFKSGGTVYPFVAGCNTKSACNDVPEIPEPRDQATLP